MIEEIFEKNINHHIATANKIRSISKEVALVTRLMSSRLKQGNKIMFCGNGGSAADSQHIAAEFVGRFVEDRIPLAAMALSVDTSALTCISNDYGYEEVFSRQVIALGKPGDILVGISTSGNSGNIIKAMECAHELGVETIGLLGRDGGRLGGICQHNLIVDSTNTARIQECHILIGHTLCEGIEKILLG
jgi:D-sedoheptulose 7-phosphate isomerase